MKRGGLLGSPRNPVRLEADSRGLGVAVFLPQVTIDLHREGAAVGMPEPARNRGDIDAGLDATCREEVPEIVVRERPYPALAARRFKGAQAFPDAKDGRAGRL